MRRSGSEEGGCTVIVCALLLLLGVSVGAACVWQLSTPAAFPADDAVAAASIPPAPPSLEGRAGAPDGAVPEKPLASRRRSLRLTRFSDEIERTPFYRNDDATIDAMQGARASGTVRRLTQESAGDGFTVSTIFASLPLPVDWGEHPE